MLDGVVDIPLPGRSLSFAAEQGDAAPPCHFLAGPENRLVEAAVRSVIEEQIFAYNPLVFYGPAARASRIWPWGWRRRGRPANGGSESFAPRRSISHRELADAIETQGVDEFRAKHRGADFLVVEDLGMLATRKSGKSSAQEELIHTLDALVAENRWVVITASAAPATLPGIVPALAEPLDGGAGPAVGAAGRRGPMAILQQLAALRNIPLPEDGCAGACRRRDRHRAGVGGLAVSVGNAGRVRRRQRLTWKRLGNTLPIAAARGSRACMRSRWPRRGIFRCGWPICAVRSRAGRWLSPAAWRFILPGD